MFRCFLFFFSLSIASLFSFEPNVLKHLHLYGDGLNIKGGVIPKYALNRNQIWANIGFVLDTPLVDQRDLDEITSGNLYLLKESSIPDYNEAQVALVQVLILKYYLKNGGRLLGKASDQSVRMAIHVHRNSSGPAHLDLLERLIDTCFQDDHPKRIGKRIYKISNITLQLSYGTIVDFSEEFKEADIILSISLMAGLHPKWKSGTPLLSKEFIPFDLHSMVLVTSAAFPSQNHLLQVLSDVIKLQNATLIDLVNREFSSPNPLKKMKATTMTKEDFREARVFQVNGMFYPKKMIKGFEVF